MEKPSEWVSKLCRLYFADEYARRTVGLPSATHVPDIETALRAVEKILPKLEAKMIEFLAEWLVTLLIPATHVLEVRAPHLFFMLLKEYWFRELYLGLKVTASFDRSELYTRVIDGQVRCITPEIKPQNLQVIWNVQFITVFVPAWMIPPIYHSLRRESIKNASSASPIGVLTVRPTWFEDIAVPVVPKETKPQPHHAPQWQEPQPLHGLKLVIKEEVLPMKDQPEFPALALLAARGLLAPDTWIFFFRPTPSWLSPGRYTRSTAADKLNWNLLARLSIRSAASKELVVDQYTVQLQSNQKQHKPERNTHTQTNHKNKNKPTKTEKGLRPAFFFPSRLADVALKARSLHESKQLKLCTRT